MERLDNCRQHLHSQVASEECYPFGPDTQVFKIKGKMFALIGYRNGKYFINLKAKPDDVLFLIEQYDEIYSGYHMNKKHWISVDIAQVENRAMLQGLIDDSYALVKSSLPKKVQAEFN
ncbi:MmcQ/YjbR family DNA-binding protein [Vibrio sp. TH_r3]|uniref:MmcQ/YjbR family DNA-binding protein n=1 Tax=Vibrio sp. TH_r3 TaxID=3082084 RepID=UPI00295335A9|nr:MmcQ/YjbR family DNA-binding protein [Vibrio sp. TH_r3]MDV7104416.1 MmcQ/YjbR family DNA-binding protein [Vibrio sp. TH_r3]